MDTLFPCHHFANQTSRKQRSLRQDARCSSRDSDTARLGTFSSRPDSFVHSGDSCAVILEGGSWPKPTYGVATFITGQFRLSQFYDDPHRTQLETLLAQLEPQHILTDRSKNVSGGMEEMLKKRASSGMIWTQLRPAAFRHPTRAKRRLNDGGYFSSEWNKVLADGEATDATRHALESLVEHLKSHRLGQESFMECRCEWYDPFRQTDFLVLTNREWHNLGILSDAADDCRRTLLSSLDHCQTKPGKQLLRRWVTQPLRDTRAIEARLDSVDWLLRDERASTIIQKSLQIKFDLEAHIKRICPGSEYSIHMFARTLNLLDKILKMATLISDATGVIQHVLSALPDLSVEILYWKTAFDWDAAHCPGDLMLPLGSNSAFDEAQRDVLAHEEKLAGVVQKWKKKGIIYHVNRNETGHSIEVPNNFRGSIPQDWTETTHRRCAKSKRYSSRESTELILEIRNARRYRQKTAKDVLPGWYTRFASHRDQWLEVVKIAAHIDCIWSLAQAARLSRYPVHRPLFSTSDQPQIEFRGLRHPFLVDAHAECIENDFTFGGDAARWSLLTGANGAGKSTALRTICIAVIMAQIGCHVPCQSAKLTPFDRIMSRLGARDDIHAGLSTFMIEMCETSMILEHATPRSLVVLDELGRGTDAESGLRLAKAVLEELAVESGSVGIFATHLPITSTFRNHAQVHLHRMRIKSDHYTYVLEPGEASSDAMACAQKWGMSREVLDRAKAIRRGEQGVWSFEHSCVAPLSSTRDH